MSGYSVVGQGVGLRLKPRVGQRAGDVPLEVQQSLLHRTEIGRGQHGRHLRLNRKLAAPKLRHSLCSHHYLRTEFRVSIEEVGDDRGKLRLIQTLHLHERVD